MCLETVETKNPKEFRDIVLEAVQEYDPFFAKIFKFLAVLRILYEQGFISKYCRLPKGWRLVLDDLHDIHVSDEDLDTILKSEPYDYKTKDKLKQFYKAYHAESFPRTNQKTTTPEIA